MLETRLTAYSALLPLLLGVYFGVLFFDRNAMNFLMPFIQPELKLTFAQVGLLSSALSLVGAGACGIEVPTKTCS